MPHSVSTDTETESRTIIRGVTKKKRTPRRKWVKTVKREVSPNGNHYRFICCICRRRKRHYQYPVTYNAGKHLKLRSLEDPTCSSVCSTCDASISKGCPIVVKSMLPIHSKFKRCETGLVATKPYHKNEFICNYGGTALDRWCTNRADHMDKSKTIGIESHTVIDGINSHTRGPNINTGVRGVPFLANNVVKEKHSKKGAPKTLKNMSRLIPLFAGKAISVGDEFFFNYGSGFGGYQNSDNALFTRKDIISRADKIYFRECNAKRFDELFDKIIINKKTK